MDLGLFPLEMVLVPGEQIPLHLFEPRYRQLYADCVLSNTPFVLVRQEEGVAAQVGCTAVFEDLVSREQDGRLNVIVRGAQAVEIIEETQGRRYFSALCRVLEDDAEAPDEALAQEAVRRFQEFSERLTGERRDPPEIDGVPLSYAITGAMEMPTPIKQRILSLRNEPARLTSVIRAIDIAQRSTDRIELAAKRAKTNGKVSHP
ncbi:MAG: LON peptidase substrate-binding domain-containing protein [Thermoleophilia bacterium]